MKLLSRPYACVHDGNVNFGAQSAQANHLPGQVVDPNSLAHLEHENVAALRKGSSLDDQARSLRNVHEVAGHVWMRYSDRSTKLNLSRKGWHNTASTTQYIAKPYCSAPNCSVRRTPIASVAADEHFSNTLCRTHN